MIIKQHGTQPRLTGLRVKGEYLKVRLAAVLKEVFFSEQAAQLCFVAEQRANCFAVGQVCLGGDPFGQFLRLGVQAQVEQAQVVQQSLLFGALRVTRKIVIPKGGTALSNSLWNQMQLMFHLPGAKIQEEGEGSCEIIHSI